MRRSCQVKLQTQNEMPALVTEASLTKDGETVKLPRDGVKVGKGRFTNLPLTQPSQKLAALSLRPPAVR